MKEYVFKERWIFWGNFLAFAFAFAFSLRAYFSGPYWGEISIIISMGVAVSLVRYWFVPRAPEKVVVDSAKKRVIVRYSSPKKKVIDIDMQDIESVQCGVCMGRYSRVRVRFLYRNGKKFDMYFLPVEKSGDLGLVTKELPSKEVEEMVLEINMLLGEG